MLDRLHQVLRILKKTVGMRVSEEQEVMGLNAGQVGEQAYPDLMEAPAAGGDVPVGASA